MEACLRERGNKTNNIDARAAVRARVCALRSIWRLHGLTMLAVQFMRPLQPIYTSSRAAAWVGWVGIKCTPITVGRCGNRMGRGPLLLRRSSLGLTVIIILRRRGILAPLRDKASSDAPPTPNPHKKRTSNPNHTRRDPTGTSPPLFPPQSTEMRSNEGFECRPPLRPSDGGECFRWLANKRQDRIDCSRCARRLLCVCCWQHDSDDGPPNHTTGSLTSTVRRSIGRAAVAAFWGGALSSTGSRALRFKRSQTSYVARK